MFSRRKIYILLALSRSRRELRKNASTLESAIGWNCAWLRVGGGGVRFYLVEGFEH